MENQDQGPRKSRRDFLKLGVAAGLGAVAGASGREAVRTAEQLVSKQLPPDRGLNENKEASSVEVKATMQMVEYRERGELKRAPAVVIDLEAMFRGGIVDPIVTLEVGKNQGSAYRDEFIPLEGEFARTPVGVAPWPGGASAGGRGEGPGITSILPISTVGPKLELRPVSDQDGIRSHDINHLRESLALFFGVRLQPGKLVIPVFNEPVKPGDRGAKGMVARKGVVQSIKDYSLTPASAESTFGQESALFIDVFNGTPSIMKVNLNEDKIIQERNLHKSGYLIMPEFGKFVTTANKPTR